MPCCGGKGGDFPPGHVLATNAAKAVGRAAAAFVRGDRVLARGRTVINRLDVCKACPEAIPDNDKPQFLRCQKCGCWLNGKHLANAKTKLATERCPLGKWGAES